MRKILSFLSLLSLTPIISTSVVACNNSSSHGNIFDKLANIDLVLNIKTNSTKDNLLEIIKSQIILKLIQELKTNSLSFPELIIIMDGLKEKLIFNIYKLNPQEILEDEDLTNEGSLDLKITFFGINKIRSFKSVKLNINNEKTSAEIIKTINDFNYYDAYFNSPIFLVEQGKRFYVGMNIEEFQKIFESEIKNFIEKTLLFTFFTSDNFYLETIKNNDNDLTDEDLNHAGTLNLKFIYHLGEEPSVVGGIIKEIIHFTLV